jgi:bifunctional N-acetylglucosamine-1-phosphate-uridyltransferase/glucosamine-1-phosphate-acetyltransferase GlmU-like protein
MRVLVVPAAGRGSRFPGQSLKPLVPVAGEPMLHRVLRRWAPVVDAAVVVARPEGLATIQASCQLASGLPALHFEVQEQPTGMLPATLKAVPFVEWSRADEVIVTWCDQVLTSPRVVNLTVQRLAESPVVVPVAYTCDPYTHLRRGMGRILQVQQVREGDLMPHGVGESDVGVFGFRAFEFMMLRFLYACNEVPRGRVTGEVSLLTALPLLPNVDTPRVNHQEGWGVNTPAELARAEAYLARA